jgi:3',5'-cyclic AMP phosphodiesterase CpdA
MIEAAKKDVRRPVAKAHKRQRDGLWSVVVMSDLHMGSRSWRHTTGADYDLNIASAVVAKASANLIERSNGLKVVRRSIVLAGDTMHFDTVSGTTTSGTYLDRDSRLQKAIDTASAAIFRAVEHSAETTPTDVLIVPGNHDSALSFALQKILVERYRNDRRVTVNGEFTSRKYLTHGGNLIGVTHGDKAKKKLAGIMALEASALWSQCRHREWHVGHLHHQAAEISTIDGVIVRTHPTIVPPDAWHVESGFIGSERAMQGFVYSPEGGLAELHMAYARTCDGAEGKA